MLAAGLLFAVPVIVSAATGSTTLQLSANLTLPRIESSQTPERSSPKLPFTPKASSASPQARTLAPQALTAAESLGANLIPNPSVETAGTGGVPASWHKGGYGTNTRVLTYPVAGSGGAGTKAIGIAVSGYTSGDAKWYFDAVPVKASTVYEFSDASQATAPSIITAQFNLSDGTTVYTDIQHVAASGSFQTNTIRFTSPAKAVSVTIFHLLNQNGTLTTDDYSLHEVTQSQGSNPIQNPGFEIAGGNGLPASWAKGGYGTNTRAFVYPVTGNPGNAARITMSGYTNGDAKWVFTPVALAQGTYTYTDTYQSTVPSTLTVQFTNANGTLTYRDIGTLPASGGWSTASGEFSVGAGVTSVTVFHLIKANGTLTLDNAAITPKSGPAGIFTTGAVTFRFDDDLSSQYVSAVPKLESAGFKGSFYIITHETGDDGFPGFMTHAQIIDLASRGHEIGAHTRTHPDLTTLTASQQQGEICGSRQDLQSWGISPIDSFAYPFGAYDASTDSVVKSCGLSSAATSNGGYVTQASDPFQLERQSIQNSTTIAQVKQWVDSAAANHVWLIMEFHGIETSGDQYSMTPTLFNQVVDYVKQKGIPVVTVSQGAVSLQ
jgi:peptidoglycan/xylan/chitin deacetylase (PgdA/CDA1 family)